MSSFIRVERFDAFNICFRYCAAMPLLCTAHLCRYVFASFGILHRHNIRQRTNSALALPPAKNMPKPLYNPPAEFGAKVRAIISV
ncbi:MAG: hypothetical protein LBS21_06605 [Clostridiales bacterium]|nr:hypothetical protein [Clostridiales bacterium]